VNRAGQANSRYTKITEPDLSQLCSQFRTAIEERKEFLPVSAHLYEILLGELPELDSTHRLYFSLDGALNFIPFQVLKKSVESAYLVQDHVLSYLSEVPAPATNAGKMDANKTIRKTWNSIPVSLIPIACSWRESSLIRG
jgi:hypothetical protein